MFRSDGFFGVGRILNGYLESLAHNQFERVNAALAENATHLLTPIYPALLVLP